jgi:hypothetical protein
MTASPTTACPHCTAANTVGARFCEACGMALPDVARSGPQVVSDARLPSTAAGMSMHRDELAKQMKTATRTLLAVAIVQTFFGVVLYLMLRDAIAQGTVNFPVLGGTVFGVAILFFILYFWGRSNPFPATVVGLVVYVTLWVLDITVGVIQMSRGASTPGGAMTGPFNGIILKIIIVVVLVKGVKAGMKYNELSRQGGPA